MKVCNHELIGPAEEALAVCREIVAARASAGRPCVLLLYGSPGIGKSEVARRLCNEYAASGVARDQCDAARATIVHASGQEITASTVADWMRAHYVGNMYGGWACYLIEEYDLLERNGAAKLALQWIDNLPAKTLVVCTSNADCEKMAKRLQSRLESMPIDAPSIDDVIALIMSLHGLDYTTARAVAETAAVDGVPDVRAALNDAETAMARARARQRSVAA